MAVFMRVCNVNERAILFIFLNLKTFLNAFYDLLLRQKGEDIVFFRLTGSRESKMSLIPIKGGIKRPFSKFFAAIPDGVVRSVFKNYF
ncbi:MAG: hypothetical protein S4CHLAM123_04840 [Chlamydiales bacterium]|nr:hypothetical protein [Chlamydiales bacterium]